MTDSMSKGVIIAKAWTIITKTALLRMNIFVQDVVKLMRPTVATPKKRKCINCTKAGLGNTNHAAYDHKCPSLCSQVDKKKKSNERYLNLRMSIMDQL